MRNAKAGETVESCPCIRESVPRFDGHARMARLRGGGAFDSLALALTLRLGQRFNDSAVVRFVPTLCCLPLV